MTRNIDLTTERERGEASRAAAKRDQYGQADSTDGVRTRCASRCPLCGIGVLDPSNYVGCCRERWQGGAVAEPNE